MAPIKFKRIKNIRIDNDETQRSIAEKLFKISRNTYKRWETGLSPFPIEKLNIYANYFNTSFDYLTGLSNSQTAIFCKKIDTKIISKRLKEERLKRNYQQKEILPIINKAQNTYSEYENMKSSKIPNINVLYLLAREYNISLDYLCGRSDNPNIM